MSNSINKSEKLVYYFFSSHYKKIILFIFFTLILSATFSYINYKKNLRYTSDYDIIFNELSEVMLLNIINIENIHIDFIFFLKKNNLKNSYEYLVPAIERLKIVRIKINHVSLDEKNIGEVNKIQDLLERYKEELLDRMNSKLNHINNEINTLLKKNAEIIANQEIADSANLKLFIKLNENKSRLAYMITFTKNDNLFLHSHNNFIKKGLNIRQVFTKNLLTSLICSLLFILFLLWIKICISEARKD